jgi:phenylalanine-4-hydroxylase
MRYDMISGLQQEYSNYTNEDFEVWKFLFERQMPALKEVAAQEYLQGIDNICFTSDKIPDIYETNKLLGTQTGWELIVVPGIIKEPDFFNLLSQKKFPATTWIRKKESLDYLPEPDMFHDVFGHVPLLTHYHFTEFFQTIGKLGVQHLQNEQVVAMLGRLYWFTIEFGLIRTNNILKIYGAGIISSYGETKFSLSKEPKHIPYDASVIMNTPYVNDHIQDTYYVIDSFEQLYRSIETIKEVIETAL